MTVVNDLGLFGFGMATFAAGVVVGWAFAMGSMRVAVRIIMWAISYERRE